MKKEELFNIIGEVDEQKVGAAGMAMNKKKSRPVWLKWGAMAACLCLVVGLAIPVLNPKGGPGQDDPLRPLNVIEYNGAYYESIDMSDKKILDTYNLPHEITKDMVGISLGAGVDAVGEQTEQTLYQYVPYADIVTITTELEQERTQRAVYIVEDGGVYSFALFCNFVGFDSNTHTEASEMFVVYGVDEVEDIASITIDGKEVTDIDKIKALFDNLNGSYAMGNDDYQKAVFKGMSEEEQQALSIDLADSMAEIKITTTEGVVINNLCYYPTINYVYWALNYYKLNTPIE